MLIKRQNLLAVCQLKRVLSPEFDDPPSFNLTVSSPGTTAAVKVMNVRDKKSKDPSCSFMHQSIISLDNNSQFYNV